MASDAAAVWILIVDDQEIVRELCEEVIQSLGHRALMADSAIRAMEIIEQQQVDIVIADIKMSGMSGIELLEQIKTTNPQIEVVIMTGYATVPSAVQAMKLGATDYITKPFSAEEFRLVVERLVQTLELKEENRYLREQLRSRSRLGTLVGQSQKMQHVFKLIQRVSVSRSPVDPVPVFPTRLRWLGPQQSLKLSPVCIWTSVQKLGTIFKVRKRSGETRFCTRPLKEPCQDLAETCFLDFLSGLSARS